MRLIDADALMLHLADYELQESPCWGANGHGNETAYLTIKECEKAVEEQPTIDADRPQEWIPCSERLPARQGYYICTCKDGSRALKTTTIKWSNGWQLSGSRAYWKVIAWMPLPEPWKGADDEKGY